MVGDWVYNKHHGKNIRLTQYDFFTHTHNEFSEQELAPFAKPTFGRDLEPIPLEKIHLAKNGFEVRDGTDDMEFFYNDGYEVKVMFDEGCVIYEQDGKTIFTKIPPSIFLVIEFAEKSLQMPIEYIHELQQTMRIMGCDKEIEL